MNGASRDSPHHYRRSVEHNIMPSVVVEAGTACRRRGRARKAFSNGRTNLDSACDRMPRAKWPPNVASGQQSTPSRAMRLLLGRCWREKVFYGLQHAIAAEGSTCPSPRWTCFFHHTAAVGAGFPRIALLPIEPA